MPLRVDSKAEVNLELHTQSSKEVLLKATERSVAGVIAKLQL